MTEQQLQEIEARAEAATPGTVRWMKVRSHGFGITLDVDTMPNAELIANGRQWVLSLVAEVRRLREGLEEVLEQVGTSDALPPDLTLTAIENIADRALHPEEGT